MTETPRETVGLSKLVAAFLGVLGLAAALAAGHLVAAFVGANASPYLAVGNSAIDLTPTWLKDWAIRTFGVYDKLVLLGGMALVLVAVAVVAGVLSRRSPLPATVAITVFGVLGGIAVFTRPDLGQLALLAPAVSLAAGLIVFRWLHALALRRAREASVTAETSGTSEEQGQEQGQGQDRRRFLIGATSVAIGAGLAGGGGQLLARTKDAETSRAALKPFFAARTKLQAPPGADFARQGTPTFLTRNADFYRIDTALVVPQVRAEDWTLRIHGMVDRELALTYDDIRARGLVERTITLCCVSNPVGGPYISNTNFLGVELAGLLADAGIRPGAEQLLSTSTDGWTCGTPVDVVADPARGALLALGMNGEPLPLEHGFPARMVVPGLYGYVSATKWVTDLEVTTWARRRAYWLDRGWAREAPVKTQSRIDAPAGGATVGAGRVEVAGVAWAQFTGVRAVEVRLDDGPWQRAELAADVDDNTWRMWRITLDDVRPGKHKLACRATDKSGYQQTGAVAGVIPDGATGWHLIDITAA